MSTPTLTGANVTLRPACGGHDYDVKHNGRVVASGWVRGTKREAIDEALAHGRAALAQHEKGASK